MGATQALTHMSNGVDVDPETNTIRGERKLRESGNSVVLTIPREILSAVGFTPDDRVEISAEMGGDEIVIRELGEAEHPAD